jgi:hypothetical protein
MEHSSNLNFFVTICIPRRNNFFECITKMFNFYQIFLDCKVFPKQIEGRKLKKLGLFSNKKSTFLMHYEPRSDVIHCKSTILWNLYLLSQVLKFTHHLKLQTNQTKIWHDQNFACPIFLFIWNQVIPQFVVHALIQFNDVLKWSP